MNISNPRRILAVSLADADSTRHLSRVIKDLTGTFPTPSPNSASPSPSPSPSLAGTTHILPLTTAYYTAQIPVWLDLIESPADWTLSFLAPEAREVLAVLGGVVVVFALSSPISSSSGSGPDSAASSTAADARALVSHVGRVVRDGLGGWEWDGVGLAIGVGDLATTSIVVGGGTNESGNENWGGEALRGADPDPDAVLGEWEDLCAEWGLEFVHAPLSVPPRTNTATTATSAATAAGDADEEGPRNEFGERVGIARALEALQANDWAGGGAGGGDGNGDEDEDEEFGGFVAGEGKVGEGRHEEKEDEGDGDGDDLNPESLDFGFDRADFAGLRKAIWSTGREDNDNDDDDFFLVNGKGKEGSTATGAGARAGEPSNDRGGDGDRNGEGEGEGDEAFGDKDVQKLERMMHKLQAVRDMSAGLPDEQRRRLARRAVSEAMKEL